MDERRTRHWSWLALFLFLITVSAGCEMPPSGGAAGTAARWPWTGYSTRSRKSACGGAGAETPLLSSATRSSFIASRSRRPGNRAPAPAYGR